LFKLTVRANSWFPDRVSRLKMLGMSPVVTPQSVIMEWDQPNWYFGGPRLCSQLWDHFPDKCWNITQINPWLLSCRSCAVHYYLITVSFDGVQCALLTAPINKWVLGRARYFSLLQNIQTGCGAHLASYLVCTRCPSPGVELARL
jgi:hypothetical protein